VGRSFRPWVTSSFRRPAEQIKWKKDHDRNRGGDDEVLCHLDAIGAPHAWAGSVTTMVRNGFHDAAQQIAGAGFE
jgi:hypothetical protein